MSLDEILAIPTDFRKELLSILSAFSEISDNCEKAIVKLIYNVNDSDVDKAFNMLKEKSILEPNGVILNNLIGGVQDAIFGIFGSDNFKDFNKAVVHLASKSPSFKQKKTAGDLFYISHSYTNIFMRAFETFGQADDYAIGTSRMDVTLTGEANLEVKVKEVVGRKVTNPGGAPMPSSIGAIPNFETTAAIWEEKDPVTLDPFEPVMYIKDNDLGMLADWQKEEEYVLPALFLHYADTKAGNETISDASMAAIDLLGLATGYGELKMGVTGIRKFWAVADLVNSGVNLTANVTSLDENPAFKPFLDFYNLGTAASNIGRIVTSTKTMKALYQQINNIDLSKVDIDYAMKLRTFNSNEFVIDNLTEEQLLVFRRHFERLNKEAATRGSLPNIEEASKKALEKINGRLSAVAKTGAKIEDLINKQVVKTITNYDRKLGTLVEYPKYNNVALGKDMGGKLEAFGKDVGANVWTRETEAIFTKMYDLPDSWSFERSMTSVLNETVGTNQGKILFDISSVDIPKAIKGGLVHNSELVLRNSVTELELQMILRNKSWYDNVIFHESGKVLIQEELANKGIKLLQ